jgi:two-component system chemotaxis response regulator CheY
MLNSKQTPNILVVDDYASMRKLVKTQLRHMGFDNVSEATNGQDALDILHEGDTDLVISDWNMPKMDGYELLKAIRDDDTLQETSFIMVTAEASPENISMVMQLKVDQLILKPFTLAVLEQKINQVIQ